MRLHVLLATALLAGFAMLTAATPAMADCGGESIRPDLAGRWKDASGKLRWPNEEWSSGINVTILLMPGTVIDRFGCADGNRFSPQGTAFSARALPYDCTSLPYHSYRVAKPLLVRTATAPSWFGQSGGGTQYRSTVPAAQLLSEGSIEPVDAARPSCA